MFLFVLPTDQAGHQLCPVTMHMLVETISPQFWCCVCALQIKLPISCALSTCTFVTTSAQTSWCCLCAPQIKLAVTSALSTCICLSKPLLKHLGAVCNVLQIKLAISYALAQSTKLSLHERRVTDMVLETKHLPESLARSGKMQLSPDTIAKLIGRVFIQKVRQPGMCSLGFRFNVSRCLGGRAAQISASGERGVKVACRPWCSDFGRIPEMPVNLCHSLCSTAHTLS